MKQLPQGLDVPPRDLVLPQVTGVPPFPQGPVVSFPPEPWHEGMGRQTAGGVSAHHENAGTL